jgi:hypothetical protein
MCIYILHEYTKINSVLTTLGMHCIVQFRTFSGGSRIEFACMYVYSRWKKGGCLSSALNDVYPTTTARMIIYSRVHHVRPQAVPSYTSLSAQTIYIYIYIMVLS